MSAKAQTLRIGDRDIRITNTGKVFYPKEQFTKGDVIAYYARIAPILLPYIKGRALTLKRYPDGVDGGFFYEKQCPAHAPEWISTTRVKKSDGSIIKYCTINDPAALLWAVNLANLEFHPFLHLARSPGTPCGVMFDLDPGSPAGLVQCARVALRLHDLFRTLGLKSFAKTSGSKGMQLFVPLNTPVRYSQTKSFARAVATALSQRFPEAVTADMKKNLRRGKIFIDWSQNDGKKTTVAPYSLRAREQPTASTPVTWEEIRHSIRRQSPASLIFTAGEVLRRIERLGDLYAPTLTLRQSLPEIKALPQPGG